LQLLGRAKEASDFIKHGCDSGYTEIELAGGPGKDNIVIRHEIRRDNSSPWKINGSPKLLSLLFPPSLLHLFALFICIIWETKQTGKPAKKGDVKKIVADLNIQVDNLCQFLPQDKVVNFAQLGPCDLLKETEKAAGSAEMLVMHTQLIELKTREKHLTTVSAFSKTALLSPLFQFFLFSFFFKPPNQKKKKTCGEHEKRLEDLETRQEQVRRDVLRFKERQKHLEKVLWLSNAPSLVDLVWVSSGS
jgi:hypothetical protein